MAAQPPDGKSPQKAKESEKKQPEEAAKAVENRLTPIFDRSFDCVYVYDLDRNFIYGNKTMMELTGYTKEDMPKLDFPSFLSPDQIPEALESMQLILRDGFDEKLRNYRIKTKNGDEIVVETRGSLIFHEGKPFAVQGIARDVTERIKAEQKLKASKERYRKINPGIPVIMCTGYSDKIDEDRAGEIGIDAFMMKPVDMGRLARTVREVLDEKKTA